MSRPEDQIVFEDLHGSNEDKPITVDLDADSKDSGITRTPADQAADTDVIKDDDIQLDGLRSADGADDSAAADSETDDKDDASKGGADGEYSKKVKARIQRATRATGKERQRADYWEAQAKQLAKENYEGEKKAAERIIERADTQLEDTQSQLETAIEDGKTKDQVRLTTLLTDQKAARVRAEVTLENLSPDGNVQPFSGKVPTSTADSDKKLSDQWMDDREDWYGAKGFERQTRLANRLDKEVFDDGYRPDTEEYFEELDRRIKAKEPSLYEDLDDSADDTGEDDKPDKGRGKSTVVAPVSGADSRRTKSKGSKVELGERDFAVMREFNLDPNDPEVLKEFARNKQEAEAGEQS